MGERQDVWLARVYGAAGDIDELRRAYDEWAATYDADVGVLGYINPAVVAGMVARHLEAGQGPILDAGAGTGIVGEVLAPLGYGPIAALDLSAGMLEVARSKGVYDAFHKMLLGEPLELPSDHFAAVIGSGVFTFGHAPAVAFDELARVTKPGGLIFLPIGEQAFEKLGYQARAEALTGAAAWREKALSGAYVVMPGAVPELRLPARVHVLEVL